MQRIPSITPEDLDDGQKRVFDLFQQGRPGGVKGGPLVAWLHAPDMAERAQSLGVYCRYGSSLPARLSELAILITAAHWELAYEWRAHIQPARDAGLEHEIIESIRRKVAPTFSHDHDEAVYRFCTELLRTRRVSGPTWERAHNLLENRSVVDLIAVLGYYGLISMTIAAINIESEPVEFGQSGACTAW